MNISQVKDDGEDYLDTQTEAFQQIKAKVDGVPRNVQDEYGDGDDTDSEDEAADDPITEAESQLLRRTPAHDRFRDTLPQSKLAYSNDILRLDELTKVDDLSQAKALWIDLLSKGGYRALGSMLLKDEIDVRYPNSATVNDRDADWILRHVRHILASTPQRVLNGVINGNLALQAKRDAFTKSILDQLWAQAEHQPSIYQQLLVNQDCLSPTPSELAQAVKYAQAYLATGSDADWKLANKLDNAKHSVTPQQSQSEYRFYMTASRGSKKDNTYREWRSDTRVRKTHTFNRKLIERFKSDPKYKSANNEFLTTPLPFPLVEFGYSKRSIRRLQSHAQHTSSNYITNLYEAIFAFLHKEKKIKHKYFMKQFVVYLIWDPPQAEISEILFSRLGESYITNGGGFSHYPAGRSNRSARLRPHDEWAMAHEYAHKNSPFQRNIDTDTELLLNLGKKPLNQAEMDQVEAETSAIDKEIEELEREIEAKEEENIEAEREANAFVDEVVKRNKFPRIDRRRSGE